MILITINETKIVYFDVDDTLILWSGKDYVPNKWAMDHLARFHKTGYTVVVWSQSGGEWARKIVVELGLEFMVTLCLSKPLYIVDDLHPTQWLMNVIITKKED